MASKNNLATKFAKRDLIINRTFNAPRERVFNAWVDQKLMAQWWGPKWFKNPVCELDVRPGGSIRIDMRGPDGTVSPMKGIFDEIVTPQRLVFTSSALEDENGNPQLENLNTVTFIGQGKKTKLIWPAEVLKATSAAEGALEGMEEGCNQSLDRLEELLTKI
jgi:uncharacterized protein YndB with AHSA1/START domain